MQTSGPRLHPDQRLLPVSSPPCVRPIIPLPLPPSLSSPSLPPFPPPPSLPSLPPALPDLPPCAGRLRRPGLELRMPAGRAGVTAGPWGCEQPSHGAGRRRQRGGAASKRPGGWEQQPTLLAQGCAAPPHTVSTPLRASPPSFARVQVCQATQFAPIMVANMGGQAAGGWAAGWGTCPPACGCGADPSWACGAGQSCWWLV